MSCHCMQLVAVSFPGQTLVTHQKSLWIRESRCMCIIIYYTSRRAGLWLRFCHCLRYDCLESALVQVSSTWRDPRLKLNNKTDGAEEDTWHYHSESHGPLTNKGPECALNVTEGSFWEKKNAVTLYHYVLSTSYKVRHRAFLVLKHTVVLINSFSLTCFLNA